MSATAGYKLFTPFTIGNNLVLKNRVVLAPLTRARSNADTRVPTAINERYYEQRAGAGLLVTEATGISEQGHGWGGAPALYNDAHMEGWKKVVDRVHAKDSKIFLQLWHMGRQAHSSFNPQNEVVSASAIAVPGDGHVRNAQGEMVPYDTPRALETHEIARIVEDYAKSAELAKQAGFDGVELHAGNGYLIDTFLQSCSNAREDKYGGSIENRTRFLLEVVDALTNVWDSDRIGVRLAPNGGFGGMGSADNYDQFMYAMQQLSTRKLGYVAILDGVGFGYHGKDRVVTAFDAKTAFQGTIMANCGYTRDTAEGVLGSGAADLVSFGRPYISTPDLAERFANDQPLNEPAEYAAYWDSSMGAKGYIDYPTYSEMTK